MKLRFWLLDVNSEQTKGEMPQLWLWGINSLGNRVLVIDRNFVDYFYVVVDESCEAKQVGEEIRSAYDSMLFKLEIVERRYFGKPVQTVKVYCNDKAKLAKQLRKLEGVKECLEDDVRASMRYLIDNNIVPSSWHEVEVEEIDNMLGIQVDKTYIAKSLPKWLEKNPPALRVLGFYMICYSLEGSPKSDRNPVIILSTMNSEGEEKQFLADENRNDRQMLKDFIQYVQQYSPDILAGYGTNTTVLSYLKERCKILGLKLRLDRADMEPHTSVYGHMSLEGMANLDLADFADQFPTVKVKSLENLADHLGVMKLDERKIIWDVDYPTYWDDEQKRAELMQLAKDNAFCVKKMTLQLLESAIELSSLISLPLDHVMTAAAGFRVDWFLIKQAQKIGELVPKRTEQPYMPYAGGLVLKPQPGLHENIAVLDFNSMYPSIMIRYNLSPDTYVLPTDKTPEETFTAPEVNHRFRKQPPGFFKDVLIYLIGVRRDVRTKMKKLGRGSLEHSILDARQKAIKIITNATYGYAGWVGARWYSKPVAEAATAWGRHSILASVKMAEEMGLRVIYGDTDSVFVTCDEKKTGQLVQKIRQALGLSIEMGSLYVRVFFTEAKKRYAGLLEDGTLDIVGLEVIRGDWAEVAKKVQQKVLEIVLKEQSPQKAQEYVRTVVVDLKQLRVSYRDFVIWKTLTKPVEAYEVNAGHVEAARFLQSKGWKLTVGDKIGYVVLKGKGRLYSRVKPYQFANLEEVDVNYYIENQVLPAAARILEFFGISEKSLLSIQKGTQEKSLVEFFGA